MFSTSPDQYQNEVALAPARPRKPLRYLLTALPLAAFALGQWVPCAQAQEFNWKGANGGNWTDVANWNDTVPGPGNVAVFSDSGTAGATATLDADVTVAGLTFNNLVANQVIASPGGKTLTQERPLLFWDKVCEGVLCRGSCGSFWYEVVEHTHQRLPVSIPKLSSRSRTAASSAPAAIAARA